VMKKLLAELMPSQKKTGARPALLRAANPGTRCDRCALRTAATRTGLARA